MTVATARFFSIVVPCIESSPGMIVSIQSLLKQQYNNFEILLVITEVNEGKFDKNFSSFITDTKIKKVIAPYGDENVARMYGVKSARGTHICFISPGDEWYAHHLSVFNEALNKNSSASVLFTISGLHSVFNKLAIKVSDEIKSVSKNSIEVNHNFSLTQFCIDAQFLNLQSVPMLKLNSFSEKFVICLLSATAEFLMINKITCNIACQNKMQNTIEFIDREILTTVYLSRNKLDDPGLIKRKYALSYFWAVKKLFFEGSLKISVKYLMLYIKTIRRLNLNKR